MERAELRKLTHRLLDLVESGTTEMAPNSMSVPVEGYSDPLRWQREMDEIFAAVPLLLAVGGELPRPGDYKAMDVLGVPILLIRGADGVARGFLNVCRHRGAQVAAPGCGSTRRHTCPYHGWSYDTDGALVGLPGQEGFVEVDRARHGLTEIPVAERAGLIFGQTTPGQPLEIDDWLGELTALLEPVNAGAWQVVERSELPGPNWKVCYDGYLEGYHFATLHRNTLFKQVMSNVMCFDSYGPHQRVGFARQGIEALRDRPEDEWGDYDGISVIITFFPHCSLVLSNDGGFLSQLWPGPTHDRSHTTQTLFRSQRDITTEDEAALKAQAEFLYAVVKDEDYATGFGIQRALSSGAASRAGDSFVFGANEMGNQRFHQTVDAILTDGASAALGANRPRS